MCTGHVETVPFKCVGLEKVLKALLNTTACTTVIGKLVMRLAEWF